MANVMKALFGLLATVMIVMTAAPALVDAGVGDTLLVNREITVLDNDSSEITLTVATDATGAVTVDAYMDGELIAENVEIPSIAGGTKDIVVTLGELRGLMAVPFGTTAYNVVLVAANADPTDPAITHLVDDTVWITVANPENTISTKMFTLDKVVDQTGKKDELNPGDEFDVYIDIDARDDGTDRTYHGMYLTGKLYDAVTGEYLGTDETRSFTLGDESERTEVMHFNIPRQMSLSNDKEADRLKLVIEANAYESTDNKNVHGNSLWSESLDLEASEDSLYFVDATVSPSSVKAGESIFVDAEICNDGVEIQENVKVTAEIVGLNAKYTRTITSVENDDCVSWGAGIAIPAAARAGKYDVKLTAESDSGAEASYTASVEVEGGKAAPKDTEIEAVDGDEKAVGSEFTFELTNNGTERKVYELEVEGVDAELSKDLITVDAGETKDFTVKATEAGEFTVFAKVDGEVEASVDAEATSAGGIVKEQVIQVLQWVFAVIIIVAIILVIVWAVTKGRKGGDDKEVYY